MEIASLFTVVTHKKYHYLQWIFKVTEQSEKPFRLCSNTVNSEIFARILLSQKASKDIHVYKRLSQLGHDLPITVNDRVL